MKKKVFIGIFLTFVLSISIFAFLRRPVDYEKSYVVDDYDIKETYDKEKQIYTFIAMYEDRVYEYAIKSKFVHKKRLIDSLEILEEDSEVCVLLKSEKLDTYPQCFKNGESVDYDLIDIKLDDFYKREETEKKKVEYENISVLRSQQLNYAVWNSRGYYYINSDMKKTISFLEEESYYNNLSIAVDNYVLTPNYDEDYSFKHIYVLDLKTGKYVDWALDNEISFNFYYIGIKDGIVYLLDRKNRTEYSLNPKKRKIEVVSVNDEGKIWNHGWETVSMTKLVGEDYEFSYDYLFNYFVNGDILYYKGEGFQNTTKVSNRKVTKLIGVKDDTCFYLVGSKLYSYNPLCGETLLASYSEWEFNDINSIFVY